MGLAEQDLPFAWPPSPQAPVHLWLPQLPESALASVEREMQGLSYGFEGVEGFGPSAGGVIHLADALRVATLRVGDEHKGGTVIEVEVQWKRWLFEPLTFDSIRYPFVVTLGAIFVAWLGFGRGELVPTNIHRGCFLLMASLSAFLWGISAMGVFRDWQQKASQRRAPSFLDALGTTLFELGARALPVNESPFRR